MGWVTIKGNHVYIDDDTGLSKALAEHYAKKRPKQIWLSKREYAHVVSEINTWYNFREEISDKYISKAIGNYVYTFKNKGFNDYVFVGRDEIEYLLDRIEGLEDIYGEFKDE